MTSDLLLLAERQLLNDMRGFVRSLRPTHNYSKSDVKLNKAITLVLERIDEMEARASVSGEGVSND
jgi:hypothetical protein